MTRISRCVSSYAAVEANPRFLVSMLDLYEWPQILNRIMKAIEFCNIVVGLLLNSI